MAISSIFHITGIVMWIGGLLALASAFKHFAAEKPYHTAAKQFVKKFWFVSVVPGVLLTLASGFYQLSINGMGFYMKQGWFHGKLTAIFLLIAISAIYAGDKAKFLNDEDISVKRYRIFHGVIGTLFLIALAAVYLGRGA